MDMYTFMYVTNTYDQFYVYVIINESVYNLARHKHILLILTFMNITNMYI